MNSPEKIDKPSDDDYPEVKEQIEDENLASGDDADFKEIVLDLTKSDAVKGIDDEPTFLRSNTGGTNIKDLVNETHLTMMNILDDSELCELPFVMDKLRRGSLEHVKKERVGSFWGQSTLSKKSRMMIRGDQSDSDVDNSR